MRKLVILLMITIMFASCATLETRTANKQLKLEKKVVEAEMVRKTVESGNFLIKMDRLQLPRGGFVSLMPSSNYIIFNNGFIRMRLGYIGRTYDFRGITGINLNGKASSYELISDESTGIYRINIKVENNGDLFDIILSVKGEELCDATISNIRIETARYSGYLIAGK